MSLCYLSTAFHICHLFLLSHGCPPLITLTVYLVYVQMLSLQCEHYQGEKLLSSQQSLGDLSLIQERWLDKSRQLLRRHSSPDAEPPKIQLGSVLSELLKKLDTRVSGESGEDQ